MRVRVCYCLVLLAAVALLASSSSAANDRPLIYGMNPTPTEWWEIDPLVWDPILYTKMRQAGCTSARIGVNWDQIESVKGVRDWSEMDRLVTLCLDNNIEPVLLINSTPEWALPFDVDPLVDFPTARYPPREEMGVEFDKWCYDLVRRYRGRARYYEFWNEANGYGWYTALQNPPSFSRADLYTPWMIRAYKAVKLADPTAQMSTTGIDDGGNGHAAYFLQQIYSYGGKGYFDAVADHPYPYGGDFQSFKLDDIRNTLDAYGDEHVNVWITEFGYSWGSFVNELNYYFDTLIQPQYDFVRIATWHTANEFPWEAGFGLLHMNLNPVGLDPKPEYTAFQARSKPSRPSISQVQAVALSPTSARVTYTTSMPARGVVMYGEDSTYGSITGRDAMATTSHGATILGLKPATKYFYRVRAGAVEDGDAFSAGFTFNTPAGDAVQIIGQPQVSEITTHSARVTWTTDIASTSTVHYSRDFSYDLISTEEGLTTSHNVELTGLQEGANYQFRVVSTAQMVADGVREGRGFSTVAANRILINGGFEDTTYGWTFWEVYPWRPDYSYNGHIGIRLDDKGAMPPSPHSMEGVRRVSLEAGWASAVGGLYQSLDVENGAYVLSGWVAAGCDGGVESIQLVGIDGPLPAGIVPEGVTVANLTASAPWGHYSRRVDVTTGQLTIVLRVSQWSAVNAVAGHFDGIEVTAVQEASVAEIRSLPPETQVLTATGAVVSAVFGNNTFYISSDNGVSGIRVVTARPAVVQEGQPVVVAGTLRLVDGEPVIDEASLLGG